MESRSSAQSTLKIDLNLLKLSLPGSEGLPERKEITTVLVKRPSKQTYIRVHSEPNWQLRTAVLELQEENETYLVDKSLWEELSNEIVPKILLSVMTRQNNFFFWPIRLPNEEGWVDPWNRSAIECAKLAQEKWIRVVSDRDAQTYHPFVAENQDNLPDPIWPSMGFESLLQLAFKDHYIDSRDHPVVKKLRGVL